jgi:hypothetical protein
VSFLNAFDSQSHADVVLLNGGDGAPSFAARVASESFDPAPLAKLRADIAGFWMGECVPDDGALGLGWCTTSCSPIYPLRGTCWSRMGVAREEAARTARRTWLKSDFMAGAVACPRWTASSHRSVFQRDQKLLNCRSSCYGM